MLYDAKAAFIMMQPTPTLTPSPTATPMPVCDQACQELRELQRKHNCKRFQLRIQNM